MRRLLIGLISGTIALALWLAWIQSSNELSVDEVLVSKRSASERTEIHVHRSETEYAELSADVEESRILTLMQGTGEEVNWTSRRPASKQTEKVRFNQQLLTDEPVLRQGDRLVVELEPGRSVRANVTEVKAWGNGTVAVTGHLPSHPEGRLFLSYTDGVALMTILDPATGKTFEVQYDRGRQAYLRHEVDRAHSDFLECGGDELWHPEHEGAEAHSALAGAEVLADAPTDVVTLNVLVVYSPAAVAAIGTEPDMLNRISMAMQLSNDVHSNSQTYIQLNLAHSEEIVYTADENDAGTPGQYLDDVRDDSDGEIDNVHTLRDTHAADFVVFVVNTNQTGGLAYRSASYIREDLAFCIVRSAQFGTTSYTTVHEIGHNMGLGHSATQTSSPDTGIFYSYAAGWQWADATVSAPFTTGYCTVMTYENFDNNGGNGPEYERVAHFSNPDVTFNGNPTGDATTGNAAQVVRNGRFEYAGFRGLKPAFNGVIDTFPYSLSFEDYTDTWYQPDDDTYEWDTTYGPTPDRDFGNPTGPLAASDGAFYMFIESTYNYTVATESVLQASVDFTGYENAAFTFDYHLYLTSGGTLYLEVSTDGGSSWSSIWSLGDQGDGWFPANVDLSAYDGQAVLLRFRGVTGTIFLSDMALDNFVLTADPVEMFATWIAANYPGISDATAGGDPDADGMTNFLEYAFGMVPDTPDAGSGPTTSHDVLANELVISFTRARENVRYVVESSGDMDWLVPVEEWDSALGPLDLVTVGGTQEVGVPIPAGGSIFLRVDASE